MCGISGFVNMFLESGDFTTITSHRGPDDTGAYKFKNVIFGHNRLSIQDLSSNGHQPFVSKDQRFVIVFNGEIYNHWEIRDDLIAHGYKFYSQSDTETLLNGFRHYHTDILNKLKGIFAFAILDKETNQLFMARDQYGVKPFYYYSDDDVFAFASELKAFWQYDDIDRQLDKTIFSDYVNYLYAPGERTPFKKIKKLLPGYFIQFNLDNPVIQPHKYYDIPFNGKYVNDSEEMLIDQLDALLKQAVKRQMLADVEVGFFLSGGLDSSLLVAIAKKMFPHKKLQAFTVRSNIEQGNEGFTDDLFYAQQVASHLEIDLQVVDTNINILKDLDRMVWHLEEPQADPAALNVLRICERAVAMDFKVLIGGTGGDDVLSGYRRHQALAFEKYFEKMPLFVRNIINAGLKGTPTFNATVRRLKKIASGINKPKEERILAMYSWLPFELLVNLFSDDVKDVLNTRRPNEYLHSLLKNIPDESDWLNRMLYLEMRSFLVDHNLNYTDKMAMAVGVEVRVPYLDKDVVEFCASLPPNMKMRGKETKYILKKVAERYLPKEVIYRPKTGFGAPLRGWIRTELNEMIEDRLAREKLSARGIFNPQRVWKLIEDNRSGKLDASYTIFSLLVIESWLQQFVDKKRNRPKKHEANYSVAENRRNYS